MRPNPPPSISSPALFASLPPLAAVALLAANDHLLKGSGLLPGWLTGKLSDFAGLFFFPLLLSALVALAFPPAGSRLLALDTAAALVTALGFGAVKLLPAADGAWEVALGTVRGVGRVVNVRDPTDLLALPMVALAVLWAERSRRRARIIARRVP